LIQVSNLDAQVDPGLDVGIRVGAPGLGVWEKGESYRYNSHLAEEDLAFVSEETPNPKKRLSARERAAQRAAEAAATRAKARQRRRLLAVGGPILAVIVIVAALVIVKTTTGSGSPKSGPSATAAAGSVISDVTTVPAAVFDAVGVGTIKAYPKLVTGSATPLTANGLPRILYVGAEYCPYCATERWAMVAALSRFGTFSNLGQTASSANDVYPSTATLSFHGSSFTSTTVSFTGVETESNQVQGSGYAPLDTLSAADAATFKQFDAAPYTTSAGSIPFVTIGNKYIISGASYDPQLLQGKTAAQIAAALSDPTSAIAKGAIGTANVITAAICATTKNAPASVCTSAGVVAATKALATANNANQ
jgi:Domain of unknown function (DUF929)